MKSPIKLYKAFIEWMDYNPPGALSSTGWRLFRIEFKKKAPIRYWLTKQIPRLYRPIFWKYDEICNWIRYRTTARFHIVQSGLSPGYYSNNEIMLNANFNILKTYVECDQAWFSYCMSGARRAEQTFIKRYMPFYYLIFKFRRPDIGLAHFRWAATLDDTTLPPNARSPRQAEEAREIIALYTWWVTQRPARIEIVPDRWRKDKIIDDDMFGIDDPSDPDDPDEYKVHRSQLDAMWNQEQDWVKEDTDMLVRLMKIRHALST